MLRGLAAALVAGWLLAPAAVSGQEDASDDKTPRESTSDAGRDDASSRGSDATETVLWLFHESSSEGDEYTTFRESLGRTLSDAPRRHLVSREDFTSYLAERSIMLPPCIKGTEACVSPRALVSGQLGLDAVVRIEFRTGADELRADYRLVDSRGRTAKEASVTRKPPDELAFALVRQLFDATGTATLQSEPAGANVRIDGKDVGTTPTDIRLPVGTHTYRLQLPDRKTIEGTFEIASGSNIDINRRLEKKSSYLVIENAPDDAIVHIDGRKRGTAGTKIEVDPGSHPVRVTADGYDSHETTVELPAGETVRRSAPMTPDPSLLKDISTNAIARNRYIARLTFDQSLHPTSFRDARGDLRGTTYEFQAFADSSGGADPTRYTFDPRGLRADLSYSWRHFGVVGFSLSYTATSIDRPAIFESAPPAERDRRGTIRAIRRLQLRPLQVTYRRFYKNFAPAIELGTGISFQWLDVEGLDPNRRGRSILFDQTTAFWTIGVSAQYFFNENWFGVVRYSFQDYFDDAAGVEHVVSIGAGAAYPDVFGFAPEPPEEL